MAVDIGPRIGIDGEAEFRKQLQNINQQMKTLGSEMKAVTSAFIDSDDAQGKLAAQSKVLADQIRVQKDRIAEVQKALDHSTAAYGEADSRTLKWKQVLNEATAQLNGMEAQLKKNNGKLEDFDDAVEESSGSLDAFGVAAGNLISSGIEALTGAVAGLIDSLWNLDEATEEYRIAQGNVTTAFQAAGMGADAARTAYDEFYKILGDTGTAAESAQLLASLAQSEEDVATWAEIAAGAAGTFGDALPINSLIEAANETAKTGEVTGALADALNWAGESEDSLNEALAAASTEQERNQIIMETLNGLYGEAADAFYKNNEQIIAARENEALLNEVTGQLGETISNLKTSVMSEFAPAIAGVGTAFNDLLLGADGADEAFAQAISQLITVTLEQLPTFLDAGLQLISSLVTGILDNLPLLAESAVQLCGQLVASIAELLPTIVDSGLELAESLTSGIVEKGIPYLVEKIPQIIESFVNFITENLPKILETGVSILTQLTMGIISYIPTLVGRLPEIISAIGTGLAKLAAELLPSSGEGLLSKVWQGIKDWIPKLVENLPQVVAGIVNGFGALAGSFLQIGVNIVKGIWDGIKNTANWLVNQLTSWLGGVVGDVKRFLGIHSPSTLFADQIGANLALGIGVGFSDELDGVARDMRKEMLSGKLGISAKYVSNAMADRFQKALTEITRGGKLDATGIGKAIADSVESGFNYELDRKTLSGFVDGIKEVTENKSLLTAFKSFGDSLAESLSRGLLDGVDAAKKAVESLKDFRTVQAGASSSFEEISGAITAGRKSENEGLPGLISNAVNGLATAAQIRNGSITIEIPLVVNGREFFRATIDDLRAVMRSNPEVTSEV